MANNLFHIPGQSEPQPEHQSEAFSLHHETPASQLSESPLLDAMSIADSYQYTPESQPEAFRLFINDATHIDGHRDTALEAVVARNKGIFNSFGRWREQPTVEDLIEKERSLTYSDASFWLGSRHDIGTDGREQQGEEVAHWYYHKYVRNADGSVGETAIHYETRPATMFKWVLGVPYPVDIDEIERFGQTVRHYKAKVTELHSPLDANLEMLQEEEDDEKIIDARTKMVMFSKPVVDRMVADFRVRQAADALMAQQAVEKLNEQHDLQQQHLMQDQAQKQALDSQTRFQARRDANEDQNRQSENRRAA